MKKIKVRVIIENVNFLELIDRVEIFKVLNGGWASFKFYQCKCCGEIYVTELHNVKDVEAYDNNCIQCNMELKKNLLDYPMQILLNNKVVNTNIDLTFMADVENSIVKEFYLLPTIARF